MIENKIKKAIIEPRILKGFRDFLPDQEMLRRRIQAQLEAVMQLYGFVPIDTPVLEYEEVLLGKGGGETEKQVYRFTDHGDRPLAMRFDLTVPFARYMATNRNQLYLPFKRFHFAKVWRGENAQKGRYREFMQCDFDMVGVDSAGADFEILLLMNRSFKALGINNITFKISHRGIFNRLLIKHEIQEHGVELLRRVDKLAKIGPAATQELVAELIGQDKAQILMSFICHQGIGNYKENNHILDTMETLAGGSDHDSNRVRHILAMAEKTGIHERIVLDPSITRGLDYYTGIVFETFLDQLPQIGSVCSGGRYNNLAELYSKESLPGVGASIGLDRLIAGLEELSALGDKPIACDVLILCQDEELFTEYHIMAELLRAVNLRTEVYPQAKKLSAQFNFMEQKNIPWAIIVGQNEAQQGLINLKNQISRNTHEGISLETAIQIIQAT